MAKAATSILREDQTSRRQFLPMNTIYAPLESHPFESSKADDFKCATCSKPRALHVNDGFRCTHSDPPPVWAPRLRSANIGGTLVGKPLTDKKIEQYEEDGWYSEAFREARRTRMQKRRSGNFLKSEDGRLIYQPL